MHLSFLLLLLLAITYANIQTLSSEQENVFSEVIGGVHCVLTSHHHVEGMSHEGIEHIAFTFTIRNGRVEQV